MRKGEFVEKMYCACLFIAKDQYHTKQELQNLKISRVTTRKWGQNFITEKIAILAIIVLLGLIICVHFECFICPNLKLP